MTKRSILLISAVLGMSLIRASSHVDPKIVDAVSKLVLEVDRTYQLSPQLASCCPGLKTEYDALNVLFQAIAAGNTTSQVWRAVYRLRDMGDGAWYLEYEGAAFEALRQSPTAYYHRFLKGDDRAAMLLDQAFDWAIDEIEVGPGCETEWQATAERSEKVLAEALQAIRSAPDSGPLPSSRRVTFLAEADKRYAEWRDYLDRHKETCGGHEQHVQ